jgi:hypothetical protein
MSCFPFLLSFLTITSPLLFSSPLLFTLRPILSTLTVGVFCYQCFEHSSRQWMCRYSRFPAGSWGEYRDKRRGDATHKHAYSDISLLYLISYMIFSSILFSSILLFYILFYSILSYQILFYSIRLYSIPFFSTLLYSIIFCSTLS